MSNLTKVAAAALAGTMLIGVVSEASAARANRLYRQGHAGYGYRQHYTRTNPAVGAAVAGTALGIIGLAAGAAAANQYDDGYYGAPGYYNAPGYAPYGYGYDPY